ncbi:hypothetical protein LTR84_005750 [Exophiala bonariae]|uniref:Enoyl reductase (ER) domain-containing protein n=1 Tax=Exophiala bonariae TaxID=1690606 RepID=A0AAV9N3K7_9EURO|nr:hypothetical protein LTR84_005750 [Exophiala bonariae]
MDAWAIVEYGKPIQKVRIALPEPKDSEVLIKVTHSGICHSDLHIWEGFYNLGGGKKMQMSDRGVTLPHAMGHEVIGTVARLGPDVNDLGIGDRRIIFPWIGCGLCSTCLKGHENLCDKPQSIGIFQNGGMATHVLVKNPKYLVDPGNVAPEMACTFACSGTTVMSAIQKLFPWSLERPVLVIGAGGLGLTAVSILKAIGHRVILSTDLNSSNRQAALKAGATGTVDAKAVDAREQILTISGEPILAVLDCVGNSETAELGLAVLAKGGKMVVIGLIGGELKLSLVAFVARAATLLGNTTGTIQHLQEVTRLANEGLFVPIPVTTIPRSKAPEALELLKTGQVTGRLVLV